MTVDPNDLDALFASRHSCRAFLPDQVTRGDIEAILKTAQKVPSWCNAQPWHVTLTSGAETDQFRTALQAEATSAAARPDVPFPARYSGAYQDRRRATAWQLFDAVGIEKGDRAASGQQTMKNFAMFNAPHCAILSTPAELAPYGAVDCGSFVTGFTLAAQARGIATIPQAALASFSPFLHRYFDIPGDRLILCAISFGYSDTAHPANNFRTTRADLVEFVDWRG